MKDESKPTHFISLGRQSEAIVSRCANTGSLETEQPKKLGTQLPADARQGDGKKRSKEENVRPVGRQKHAPHVPIPKLQQRVLEMEFASKADFRGWGGGKPSSNPKPTAARTKPRNQRSRE